MEDIKFWLLGLWFTMTGGSYAYTYNETSKLKEEQKKAVTKDDLTALHEDMTDKHNKTTDQLNILIQHLLDKKED